MPLAIVKKTPILHLDVVTPSMKVYPRVVIEPVIDMLTARGLALVGSYRHPDEGETFLQRYGEKLRVWKGDTPPSEQHLYGNTKFTHITERVWVEKKTVWATIRVHDTHYGRRLCALMDTHGADHFGVFADMQAKIDRQVAVITRWVPESLDYITPPEDPTYGQI